MDNKRFSSKVKKVITKSRDEAVRLGHDFIGLEHLLLGILLDRDGLAMKVLESLDVDATELKQIIEESVKERSTVSTGLSIGDLPFNKQVEKILKDTFLEAKMLKNEEVDPEHVILSILKHKENPASKILSQLDVDYDIYKAELEYVAEELYSIASSNIESHDEKESQQKTGEIHTPFLDQISKDLQDTTQKRKTGNIIWDGTKESDQLGRILCRKIKKHGLIVGDPEMGDKSLLLNVPESLLLKIRLAKNMQNPKFIFLDIGQIFNPAKFDKKECRNFLEGLSKEMIEVQNHFVFCIRNILPWLENSETRADFIRYFFDEQGYTIIHTISKDGFREFVEKNFSLRTRFSLIPLSIFKLSDVKELLNTQIPTFEDQYNISIPVEVATLIVDIADTFESDFRLPQVAVDLLDEVCAASLNQLKVPQYIKDQEDKIETIKELKNWAVKSQQYERAAALRDEESKASRILEFSKVQLLDTFDKQKHQLTENDVFEVVKLRTGISIEDLKKKVAS